MISWTHMNFNWLYFLLATLIMQSLKVIPKYIIMHNGFYVLMHSNNCSIRGVSLNILLYRGNLTLFWLDMIACYIILKSSAQLKIGFEKLWLMQRLVVEWRILMIPDWGLDDCVIYQLNMWLIVVCLISFSFLVLSNVCQERLTWRLGGLWFSRHGSWIMGSFWI